MTIQRIDLLVAVLLAVFGVYLVASGISFGFMQGTTPGSGFFPLLAGGALTVLSLVNVARNLAGLEHIRTDMTGGDVAKFAAIVVAMVVFVLLCEPLGITIATIALMAAIGLIIRPSLDPAFLLRLAAASLLVPIACRLLFGAVLRIPLPTGPFGI
jgi:putative tricarboxylic transport membrane protein